MNVLSVFATLPDFQYVNIGQIIDPQHSLSSANALHDADICVSDIMQSSFWRDVKGTCST